MTKFAFSDSADGYYEVDCDAGSLPAWTGLFTPTQLRVPLFNPPTYQQQRAAAYPPVTDGLDAMVKGGQAWEDYKAACMAVKAKYPKV